MQYREEMESLAHRIGQHPLLELLEFDMGSPAERESIDGIERRLGFALSHSLRCLYGAFDGATLRWRVRGDLGEATQRRVDEELAPLAARYDIYNAAGVIQFLPMDEMFFGEDYEIEQLDPSGDQFDFCGDGYTNNEFTGMLRIFDAVNEFTAMAFVVQGGRSDWRMLRLTHNWFEFDQSRTTYLGDYFQFVIATWGLVSAREELFYEYRGDRRDPLTYDNDLALSKVPAILRNS
jgi:hypothetical protein